jgi:hypothetical protein
MLVPMFRSTLAAIAAAAVAGAAAQAQPVEVAPLAAPDAFSTPGRDTGLPGDLWKGASPELLRTVLPLLAAKPLSPAAARLARRLLATGAPGPAGVGSDPELTAARAKALIALGDPQAAALILARAPGVERSPALAEAVAEAALLVGDEARACAVADALTEERGAAYWLRLRAYCQLRAGETSEAQLTFDLAQAQARDAVFGRLMAARLAGTPAGAASLRNGLDLALSRSLELDVSKAKPSPAVAAALTPVTEPFPAPPTLPADAAASDAASVLLAALPDEEPTRSNTALAALQVPAGRMPAGRALALDRAVANRAAGEVGLLALWTCAEAGAAGPPVGDRARLAHALFRVGLVDDAAFFVAEGLAQAK